MGQQKYDAVQRGSQEGLQSLQSGNSDTQLDRLKEA